MTGLAQLFENFYTLTLNNDINLLLRPSNSCNLLSFNGTHHSALPLWAASDQWRRVKLSRVE